MLCAGFGLSSSIKPQYYERVTREGTSAIYMLPKSFKSQENGSWPAAAQEGQEILSKLQNWTRLVLKFSSSSFWLLVS